MNPCERCGHPMTSHDPEGKCSHAVNYGSGSCTCGHAGMQGYLRAVVPLPELLATVLHMAPGRDRLGSFYSSMQARLVGLFAEALLDQMPPTATGNALDLLTAWSDRATNGSRRAFMLQDRGGDYYASLTVFETADTKNVSFASVTSLRDAAAKAIMLASEQGHP